jgi:hypothetical protein
MEPGRRCERGWGLVVELGGWGAGCRGAGKDSSPRLQGGRTDVGDGRTEGRSSEKGRVETSRRRDGGEANAQDR